MGFWNRLFRNKNDQRTTPPTPQPAVVEPATREQIAVDPNSFFQVGMFKDAAKARYRRQNTKDMAIAAWKIAELLNEHFANYHIRCMVPASSIDKKAPAEALPVHFLIFEGNVPKVAIVIVTQYGSECRTVLATKQVCEANKIAYVKVYANGCFADWIQDGDRMNPDDVKMCKTYIITHIQEGLTQHEGKKPQPKPTPKQEVASEIDIPVNSQFRLEVFQKAAKRTYAKPSIQAMANALEKIAEMIAENFDPATVRCMVPASAIAPDCNPHALPVHFLFYDKRERPRVAMVIVTQNGYNVPNVRATKAICEGQGLHYMRIFANGSYADWMTTQPAKAPMCQAFILKHIFEVLKYRH